MLIHLDQPMLIEVVGADAGQVLHNLTTNQVRTLHVGSAIETFITDARGWVVAHGLVACAAPDRWRLLGQHPEPDTVAAHINRYIIREDAVVRNLSLEATIQIRLPSIDEPEIPTAHQNLFRVSFETFAPHAELRAMTEEGHSPTTPDQSETAHWDAARIPRLWPQMGRDIWEKCIPQELDRNTQAISFTKGCYLGQETVARLDARGQLQKKLAVVKFESPNVLSQTPVFSGETEVGQVLSVVKCDTGSIGLARLKRGYFEPGTVLICDQAEARVVRPGIDCF